MKIKVANLTNHPINTSQIIKAAKNHLAKLALNDIVEVSVVFAPSRKLLELNKHYRRKSYTPSILTFPSPLNEILISPRQAQKNLQPISELVKHGLNHLAGKTHGEN